MKKNQKGKKWIAIIVIVAGILLSGMILNTVLLQKTLNYVMSEYVSENNRQLAEHISYRVKSGQMFVSDFADTLTRMPEFLLTGDLLRRKADAMELEEVVVANRDYKIETASGETFELQTWMTEHPKIWEKPVVSYVRDQGILFSAPVKKDETVEEVVIGIQNYRDIQNLVNGEEHHKNGVRILFDRKKQEFIMVEAGKNFSRGNGRVQDLIDKIEQKGYPCVMRIGENVISVDAIAETDWVQITVMPADALMQAIGDYADRYFVLLLFSLLLFAVVLISIKTAARKKEQLFLTDSLTGGQNREGFLKQSGEYVNKRNEDEYAVLCLNIRSFRQINELWGEDAGNKTLEFVYWQLDKMKRANELVCRSSMDHFLMLIKEDTDEKVAKRVQDIVAKMNKNIRKKYGGYAIQFSVGSCRVSVAGSVSLAMNHAVYAGKQEKEKNQCSFFNEETAKKIAEENKMNDLFQESLENHDFQVYFQPKVSQRGEEGWQAEALVRWIHPEKGVIYPNQFIPLFEKNGKICQLDLYMFEEVCRLVSSWISQGRPVSKISVNVSRFHLKNAGAMLWEKYRKIKERYQIPDGVLEMELTETILIDNDQMKFIREILNGFHSCGLHVALDDFGFGYSSLALLKELDVDTLKMDRSFFLNESEKSRKVVENIIRLAHSLNMAVVAEGIEEQEQVEVLKKMGCDFIQGYVYSKPISAEEFEKWKNQ